MADRRRRSGFLSSRRRVDEVTAPRRPTERARWTAVLRLLSHWALERDEFVVDFTLQGTDACLRESPTRVRQTRGRLPRALLL